jgi:hypothetical protein
MILILKGVMGVTIIVLMAFGFFYLFNNLPINPVEFTTERIEDNSTDIISYGTTPVFAKNMRFDHNEISYFIENSCSSLRVSKMEEAFKIFNENVEIVSFSKINNEDADILIACSDEDIKVGRNLFAAGEGGPTKYIKVGEFNIIEEGKIYLYKGSECDYPIIELHELFHVFGFDHSNDPRSIMYSIYRCDQKITSDIIDILKELYSIEPLPDLRITNLNAVKNGRYLNFEITISNEGLSDVRGANLVIISEEKEIERFSLKEIYKGYARTLTVTNLKMFSSNINIIDFYVDYGNLIPEIDENNNHAQVRSPD